MSEPTRAQLRNDALGELARAETYDVTEQLEAVRVSLRALTYAVLALSAPFDIATAVQTMTVHDLPPEFGNVCEHRWAEPNSPYEHCCFREPNHVGPDGELNLHVCRCGATAEPDLTP